MSNSRFMATIDGGALSEIDSTAARLPRRSAVVRRGLLEAVIDGSIRPRTRTQLTVRCFAASLPMSRTAWLIKFFNW